MVRGWGKRSEADCLPDRLNMGVVYYPFVLCDHLCAHADGSSNDDAVRGVVVKGFWQGNGFDGNSIVNGDEFDKRQSFRFRNPIGDLHSEF